MALKHKSHVGHGIVEAFSCAQAANKEGRHKNEGERKCSFSKTTKVEIYLMG